jgi:PKHD-type hydroxylase
MKHSWFYYNKVVGDKVIDHIIKAGLDTGLKIAQVGHDKPRTDKKIRKTKISFIDEAKYPDIFKLVYDLGIKCNNMAYGFELNALQTCQFSLYEAHDKDYYDWHIDTDWMTEQMSHRKVSVVIQLSDPSEYEGGELEIRNSEFGDHKSNVMNKGTVITFPSFMEHRVTPVTKGKRMSLIGWIRGAKFR